MSDLNSDDRVAAQADDIFELLSRQNLGTLGEREVERLVEPYIDDLRRLERSDLADDAKWLCLSLLLGLYRFDRHLTPAVRGWPADFLRRLAADILLAWRNGAASELAELAEVDAFVTAQLGGWDIRAG